MIQQPTYIVTSLLYCGEDETPIYKIEEKPFYSINKALKFIQEQGEDFIDMESDEDWYYEGDRLFAFLLQERIDERSNMAMDATKLLFTRYGTLIAIDKDFYQKHNLNLPLDENICFQPGSPVLIYNSQSKALEEGVVIKTPSAPVSPNEVNKENPYQVNSENLKYYIATGINKADYYSSTTVVSPYKYSPNLSPELFRIYKSFCK